MDMHIYMDLPYFLELFIMCWNILSVSMKTNLASGCVVLNLLIISFTLALKGRTAWFTESKHWPLSALASIVGMHPIFPIPVSTNFLAPSVYSLCIVRIKWSKGITRNKGALSHIFESQSIEFGSPAQQSFYSHGIGLGPVTHFQESRY